jgi:hypothetical protein
MHYGHLLDAWAGRQNRGMRLPQQHPQRPFFPVLSFPAATLFLMALLLASTVPSAAQINANPAQLHFGSTTIGQSESLPITLTNSGSSSVTISGLSSTSGEFSIPNLKLPFVLGAGQSAALNVTFAPTVGGWEGGELAFTSTASNKKLYVLIGGVGAAGVLLKSSTSSLGFGSVALGATSTLPVVLTNAGSTGIVISQAQVSGTSFSMNGPTQPVTLLPNQTLTFNVLFSPKTAASFTGSLVVPNGPLTIPLSGTGTNNSQLLLNPTAVNFGSVDIGTTSTQPMTLTASGGAVTISGSASSSSQFALQGVAFPFTIASGTSVALNVAFTPSSNGSTSGILSLASNASNSNAQEALSGTGMTQTYTVTVSWNPSNSQVTGYNVYRGVTQGSYTKVNSALNTGTTYTDTGLTAGQTYYYVATSVSSTGQESGYSAAVQAVVP